MALADSVRHDRETGKHDPISARVAVVKERWRAIDTLRAVTTIERVGRCMTRRLPHQATIDIRTDAGGKASFGGLETCGSLWACPACSARIRQERAVEIGIAGNRWIGQGGSLEFLTFTMAHQHGERLEDLLRVLSASFRALQQSAYWRNTFKATLGLAGFVRAAEITLGQYNGWHPHLHLVLFTDREITDDERADLHYSLWSAWSMVLARRGRASSYAHGLDWRKANGVDGLAWYLCKVEDSARSLGIEVARGDVKKGRKSSRTPFEVLAEIGTAVTPHRHPDVAYWREYETATRGKRAIEWSRGLRDLLGLGEEATDEEIAATEAPVLLYQLTIDQWRLVRRYKGRGLLLIAAEIDGVAGIEAYLARLVRKSAAARVREHKALQRIHPVYGYADLRH